MTPKLKVYQAFDRALIAEIPADDAAVLEHKLDVAAKAYADRSAWLPAHRRMAILRRVSELLSENREHFAIMIAREGGKPLTDAIVEVTRGIDVSSTRRTSCAILAARKSRWA